MTYDCMRASRALEKENGRFLSTKSSCMACCFGKAKTSVAIKGRNKVIPRTTLIYTKAAAIRPAASYFELFKSSGLKRGMDASPSFVRGSTWSNHAYTNIIYEYSMLIDTG